MASDADPAIEAPQNPVPKTRSLHFTDLPRELQKEIISHVPQLDLISVSLVSRHFRDLASAELYRTFHIIFPDEDDPAYASPVDGLASGLDTFATSDYDYAKYLREISLDTISAGEKAEISYKQYLANQSCGKFMNTLFLIALRRAKALERFKWNIRVELSRPVYKALHQIDTLTYLHLRLQAGPSIYENPPPLPLYSASPSVSPFADSLAFPHHVVAQPSATLPWLNANFPEIYPSSEILTASTPPPPLLPASKFPRSKTAKKMDGASNPSTISGFKNLKTLSILDIDDLEVVTEIQKCIRNSQSTLTKLKLSFSTSLAMRARKPPPEIDPEDSDPDDEFQVVPVTAQPPPPLYDDVSGPARALRAQEERRLQEAVLGRIFDVEQPQSKKKKKQQGKRALEKETTDSAKKQPTPPGTDFINSLKAVSDRLMKEVNGSDDITAAQREILDTIEAAARKYIGEMELKRKANKQNGTVNGESSSSAAKEEGAVEVAEASSVKEEPETETTLFKENPGFNKGNEQQPNPEDIDIEAPLEDNFADDADIDSPVPASTPQKTPTKANGIHETTEAGDGALEDTTSAIVTGSDGHVVAHLESVKLLTEKLQACKEEEDRIQVELVSLLGGNKQHDDLEAKRRITDLDISLLEAKEKTVDAMIELEEAKQQVSLASQRDHSEVTRLLIGEYQRQTRGLGLQALSIYLIPVKASVLSRAINLRVLKRITLLNVGNQTPIWLLLSRENQEEPLPMRKIFTDNVCLGFLTFVQQLHEVHELYMLERPEKYKPETFAPKTTMTIEQIRQLALKKHMGSLKRLMIKNQNDMTWDLDQKTTSLICIRGGRLEELAVSMSIREIHTLLRHISLLQTLRALHVIHLRNDDTCVWVMRETKRFVIDSLSHFPQLKLEWLAIDEDEHAERIVRWKAPPKDKKKKKATSQAVNGKGKEKAVSTPNGGADPYPVLPTINNVFTSGAVGIESSDEDDEFGGFSDGTRIETIDNIHFYDILDIKIFKREAVTGRL